MRPRKPLHETVIFTFSIVMAVVYVVLGIVILFSPLGDVVLSKEIKLVFGSAIIIYGLFRLYRSIRQSRD